ncbi:MAG: NTP transferase domain-containing protein [Patescibacteria group bacterium]|jgi:bifunctional UDP-N-acetylglucosamine pyrophosphorylase/glucosamine-1-phosphate N-acetyltransferase
MKQQKKIGVVLLAAGKGSRMGLSIPKVLVPVAGQPMILRAVGAIEEGAFGMKPVVVVGYKRAQVEKAVGSRALYAGQSKQLGTGHAVATAMPLLKGKVNQVIVANGDSPFLTAAVLRKLSAMQLRTGAAMALATALVPNYRGVQRIFSKWGRIERDTTGRFVRRCIEYKDATAGERRIREVNCGQYCFNAAWLWRTLPKLQRKNVQREYYLTDLMALAVADGERVVPLVLKDWRHGVGVNTQGEVLLADRLARQ